MARDIAESKALHSGSYVEKFERSPIARVAALAARMDVKKGDVIADFACGNGMLLQSSTIAAGPITASISPRISLPPPRLQHDGCT